MGCGGSKHKANKGADGRGATTTPQPLSLQGQPPPPKKDDADPPTASEAAGPAGGGGPQPSKPPGDSKAGDKPPGPPSKAPGPPSSKPPGDAPAPPPGDAPGAAPDGGGPPPPPATSPSQVSGSAGPSRTPSDVREKIAAAGPDTLCVICFFKTGCEQCEAVRHFYQSLVSKYPQVVFLDANLSRNLHAVGEMNVTSVPTFIAFKNHREIQRYVGTDQQVLLQMVTDNL